MDTARKDGLLIDGDGPIEHNAEERQISGFQLFARAMKRDITHKFEGGTEFSRWLRTKIHGRGLSGTLSQQAVLMKMIGSMWTHASREEQNFFNNKAKVIKRAERTRIDAGPVDDAVHVSEDWQCGKICRHPTRSNCSRRGNTRQAGTKVEEYLHFAADLGVISEQMAANAGKAGEVNTTTCGNIRKKLAASTGGSIHHQENRQQKKTSSTSTAKKRKTSSSSLVSSMDPAAAGAGHEPTTSTSTSVLLKKTPKPRAPSCGANRSKLSAPTGKKAGFSLQSSSRTPNTGRRCGSTAVKGAQTKSEKSSAAKPKKAMINTKRRSFEGAASGVGGIKPGSPRSASRCDEVDDNEPDEDKEVDYSSAENCMAAMASFGLHLGIEREWIEVERQVETSGRHGKKWMQYFAATVDLTKPVDFDHKQRPRWSISYSKCGELPAVKSKAIFFTGSKLLDDGVDKPLKWRNKSDQPKSVVHASCRWTQANSRKAKSKTSPTAGGKGWV